MVYGADLWMDRRGEVGTACSSPRTGEVDIGAPGAHDLCALLARPKPQTTIPTESHAVVAEWLEHVLARRLGIRSMRALILSEAPKFFLCEAMTKARLSRTTRAQRMGACQAGESGTGSS